jgi:hypothetical protein
VSHAPWDYTRAESRNDRFAWAYHSRNKLVDGKHYEKEDVLALINYEEKTIFLASPGTGSTSISDILLRESGFKWLPSQSFVNAENRYIDYKHSGLTTLVETGFLPRTIVEEFWSFCFVRNPFDWYIAEFFRHLNWSYLLMDPHSWASENPVTRPRIEAAQNGDFESFVRLVMSQSRPPRAGKTGSWDLFYETTADCKEVFRYESMIEAETIVCNRLRLRQKSFPYVNKTPVSTRVADHLNLFTADCIHLIQDTHRPTFESYGYPLNLEDAAAARPSHRIPTELPNGFSPIQYLIKHSDVLASGIDPAYHYIRFGQFEGRSP